MARKLDCLLLCEDKEQESLIRPILKRQFSRVHVEPRKPQGGIAFVFQQYARLVKGIIRRYPQEARGLVVVVDGDTAGYPQRLEELDPCLLDAGYERRDIKKERIAVCVPCRNVETWEIWLCGRRDLNESDDYKPDFKAEKRRGAMSSEMALQAWFAQVSEADASAERAHLPSLSNGRAELARLYSLARDR